MLKSKTETTCACYEGLRSILFGYALCGVEIEFESGMSDRVGLIRKEMDAVSQRMTAGHVLDRPKREVDRRQAALNAMANGAPPSF